MKSLSKRLLHPVPARPFDFSSHGDLLCDRVSLTRLVREYGTPLYIYSATNIRQRVHLFADAFSGIRHTVCYSVKANSNLSILRLLHHAGTGFDIVSGGELERVRLAAKASLKKTVFSGVGKTADEMDAALAAGILMFNVESAGELDLLAQRARHLRKRAPIAVRVNPDVLAETHPYISTGLREHKFGVEIATAVEMYRDAARSRYLQPVGISVHIGSQIRSAEPFGKALGKVGELARELRASAQIDIRYIDAGGGLGISYQLDEKEPFDPRTAVEAYAQQVRAALRGFDGELLVEPGRFIVAQAGALITQVLYRKRNGQKNFLITDAGMNDLIRPALYQAHHAILPVRRAAGRRKLVADVVGPVCETGDFFARDRELHGVEPGECLAILDAGAYGMSLSSNYNTRSRPAEVLVEGRTHRLIRRRETLRDQLSPERNLLS